MENHQKNLVEYVKDSLEHEEDFHFLRFEILQRLNIARFEEELAHTKSQVKKGATIELAELSRTLHDYANAIRDYSYLRGQRSVDLEELRTRVPRMRKYLQRPNDGAQNPFSSHYAYFQPKDEQFHRIARLIASCLPRRFAFSADEKFMRAREFEEGMPPNAPSAFVQYLSRFTISFVVGLFILAPMIIMVLRPSITKSLITVCTAIVSFSLSMAFGASRASFGQTVVATATYAAVMVVFVGTSSAGGNS